MTHDRRRRTRVAVLLAGVLLAGCGAADNSTSSAPEGGSKLAGVVISPERRTDDLSLPMVQPGAEPTPMAFKAQPGHLLAVYFGYTSCPDICPTTMADFKAAVARVEGASERVDVAMITVDPERDTPEVLHGYITHYFPAPRGRALRTTDPAELRQVEQRFDASSTVQKAADGTVEVGHSANLIVVDDTGTIRVLWAFGTPIDDLERDLRILLDRPASSP